MKSFLMIMALPPADLPSQKVPKATCPGSAVRTASRSNWEPWHSCNMTMVYLCMSLASIAFLAVFLNVCPLIAWNNPLAFQVEAEMPVPSHRAGKQ